MGHASAARSRLQDVTNQAEISISSRHRRRTAVAKPQPFAAWLSHDQRYLAELRAGRETVERRAYVHRVERGIADGLHQAAIEHGLQLTEFADAAPGRP